MKKERLVYDEIKLYECSACGMGSYPDAHKSFISQIKNNTEVNKMAEIKKQEEATPATEEAKEKVEETKDESVAEPEVESKTEETPEETKEEPAKEETKDEVPEESEKSISAATLEKEYLATKAEIARLQDLKKMIATDVQESLKGMKVENKGISDSKKSIEKKVEIPKFERGKEAEFTENIGKALVKTGLFTG